MLEERGALSKEEGDSRREYRAMREETFQSSWLREDVEGTAEERDNVHRDAKEETWKSGKRKFEREKENGGCGS